MSLDPPHHGPPWALNDIWVEFVTPHFINLFSFYSSNYQVGEGNRGHLLHGLRRKQAKWALKTKHICVSFSVLHIGLSLPSF